MMDTISNHLRRHLLNKEKPMPSLEELKESEWDSAFESLMRNRLIMGAFRYGLFKDGARGYDRLTSIRQRLDLFESTGNGEHLVDVANLALMIYHYKDHTKFHFKSVDDGIHAEKKP